MRESKAGKLVDAGGGAIGDVLDELPVLYERCEDDWDERIMLLTELRDATFGLIDSSFRCKRVLGSVAPVAAASDESRLLVAPTSLKRDSCDPPMSTEVTLDLVLPPLTLATVLPRGVLTWSRLILRGDATIDAVLRLCFCNGFDDENDVGSDVGGDGRLFDPPGSRTGRPNLGTVTGCCCCCCC